MGVPYACYAAAGQILLLFWSQWMSDDSGGRLRHMREACTNVTPHSYHTTVALVEYGTIATVLDDTVGPQCIVLAGLHHIPHCIVLRCDIP